MTMAFKDKIKLLRKKNDLTQEELAEKLFCVRSAISNWEQGISEPDRNTIIKLSEIFKVSVDYLIGNDNNPSDPSHPSAPLPPGDSQALARYFTAMLNRKGWRSASVASAVSGAGLSPVDIGRLLQGESPLNFPEDKMIDFFYKFPPEEVIHYYKLARLQAPAVFINVESQIQELADQLSLSSDGSTETLEWAIEYFKQQYAAALKRHKENKNL